MNPRQSPDGVAEAEQVRDPDMRNRYFRHRNLRATDYRLEQVYNTERRRLLSRMISGWGVAQGFALELDGEAGLSCGSGLALDRHGRELVRRAAGKLSAQDVVRLNQDGMPAPATENDGRDRAHYLLQAHYGEHHEGPIKTADVCSCGKTEWTFVRETVIFSLRPVPDGWRETAQAGCRQCRCTAHEEPQPGGENRRAHSCLCQWTDGDIGLDREAAEMYRDICYQLTDPVPLGFVTVSFDHCNAPQFHDMDPCSPRRMIKSNDALFDLIRGCDLTRITSVSCAHWHDRIVSWADFSAQFPPDTDLGTSDPERRGPTSFTVTFSNPVLKSTLGAGCITFRAFGEEEDDGWLVAKYVPHAALISATSDENEMTSSAYIEVGSDWCDDVIWGRKSFFNQPTRIEIEIRGDLIIDCHGQAVDASCAGPGIVPSGNGTPGGVYLSTFRVQGRMAANGANTQHNQGRTQS